MIECQRYHNLFCQGSNTFHLARRAIIRTILLWSRRALIALRARMLKTARVIFPQ